MSARELLNQVRRWLRSRQGRAVLVGALASLAVTSVAAAQEPAPAPAPAPAPQPPAGPAVHPGHAAPAGHAAAPAGAHEPAGAHGAASAHEGGHGGGHHDPAPFNFADVPRFQQEKEMAARGDKDAHGNPVVPVTPYAYLLINAGILFFIYYKAGKKPVADGLQARHDSIAKELIEAAKIKADAEAKAKAYDEKLAQLGTELEQIKADIIKAGEADRARIVKEAEEKAERMKKDAQFLLDQELKQLRNDMLAYTADAAIAAAEAVLKSKVSAADHERLAAEYLDEVAGKKKSAATGGAS